MVVQKNTTDDCTLGFVRVMLLMALAFPLSEFAYVNLRINFSSAGFSWEEKLVAPLIAHLM